MCCTRQARLFTRRCGPWRLPSKVPDTTCHPGPTMGVCRGLVVAFLRAGTETSRDILEFCQRQVTAAPAVGVDLLLGLMDYRRSGKSRPPVWSTCTLEIPGSAISPHCTSVLRPSPGHFFPTLEGSTQPPVGTTMLSVYNINGHDDSRKRSKLRRGAVMWSASTY